MNFKIGQKVEALTAPKRVMTINSITVRELTAEGPQGVVICCQWPTAPNSYTHDNFKPEELRLIEE